MSHQYFVNNSQRGCEWFNHARSSGYHKVCNRQNKRLRQQYCERDLAPIKLDLPTYMVKTCTQSS